MDQPTLLTHGPALAEATIRELERFGGLILEVRQHYLDHGRTLAWLYDEDTMPADLRLAHRLNDEAVDRAYGYTGDGSDADRFAFLIKLRQQIQGDLLEAA